MDVSIPFPATTLVLPRAQSREQEADTRARTLPPSSNSGQPDAAQSHCPRGVTQIVMSACTTSVPAVS